MHVMHRTSRGLWDRPGFGNVRIIYLACEIAVEKIAWIKARIIVVLRSIVSNLTMCCVKRNIPRYRQRAGLLIYEARRLLVHQNPVLFVAQSRLWRDLVKSQLGGAAMLDDHVVFRKL